MAALFFINTGITCDRVRRHRGLGANLPPLALHRHPARTISSSFWSCGLSNKIVERTFVVFSLIYLSYIVSGIQAKPDWGAVVHNTLIPTLGGNADSSYGRRLIGTTISPYMQFFLQSAVVEKGRGPRDLWNVRADVIVGRSSGIAIAGFIIIANAATIHQPRSSTTSRRSTSTPRKRWILPRAQAARRRFAVEAVRLRILNAGLFTATVLPLATAFIVCEAFGLEAAVEPVARGTVFLHAVRRRHRPRRRPRAAVPGNRLFSSSSTRRSYRGWCCRSSSC